MNHYPGDEPTISFRSVLLWALNRQVAIEPGGGRVRVVLDAGPGAQTLGTVTTVGSVTAVAGQTNVGGIPYRDAILSSNDRVLFSVGNRRCVL